MSTELGYRHSALPEADAVKKTGAALKRVNDSNPDLKNTTINATVGVFHRPGATEMPDWYREAYNRATFDGKKQDTILSVIQSLPKQQKSSSLEMTPKMWMLFLDMAVVKLFLMEAEY
jgi:hypothetical protein